MKRSNQGVSNVISTVILTSVMLIIVLTTSFLANNVVNAKVERAQFEQAKNVILSLNKIVGKVTFEPKSSGYVRASLWTVIPYKEEIGENLQIWVNQILMHEVPINVMKIRGGNKVSVSTYEDLIGSDTLLLTDVSHPLGRVSSYQSDGAWIALDYSRVRCIYSGTSELYNGTDYEIYNLVEITVIKMTFGIFEVQEKASFTAQNIGVETYQNSFYNNFTIQVKNSDNEETIYLSDLGGDPLHPTLINFVVVNVELSILGGG